jgi:2-iminobutanoate/2-iminopropanoate deaminase
MNRLRNPATIAAPQGAYSHSVEAPAGSRTLYIAGQVGVDSKGTIGKTFEVQAENAFKNLAAVLADAGMGFADVVKVTTFLTSRDDAPALREIRSRHMGEHHAAATLLIVAGLAHPDFKIEVEMIAVKG